MEPFGDLPGMVAGIIQAARSEHQSVPSDQQFTLQVLRNLLGLAESIVATREDTGPATAEMITMLADAIRALESSLASEKPQLLQLNLFGEPMEPQTNCNGRNGHHTE